MFSLWGDVASDARVVRMTTPEEVEDLVRLFEKVADAEGWQPDGALRRWQSRSTYFGLEVEGRLAGGLQLVRPDASVTLPCQDVWPEVSTPSARCSHVAILALDKAFRGQDILFWRLVVEMWRHCVGEGINTLSIEVTPRVLPIYRRLGWPLEIRGDLRRHWGEDCYLCSLGIPEVAETLLRRAERSSFYRQIVSQAFRVSIPATAERERAAVDAPLAAAVA